MMMNPRYESVLCELEAWWMRYKGWTGPEPARPAEGRSFCCYPFRWWSIGQQVENCCLCRFSALHGASPALIMKNIAISGTWRFSLPGNNITRAIVDVDRACLWIAKERLNADADVEVDIYKKGLPDDSYEVEAVSSPLNFLSLCIGPAERCGFTATPGGAY